MSYRPPTGSRIATGKHAGYGRVGTASGTRLQTGRLATGRLGTGFRGGAEGGALNVGIKVGGRPITQQGLAMGPRMGTAAPKTGFGRVVQDDSYFVGQIRLKSAELREEIAKLQGEITELNRSHESYTSYEKRAEALAKEIGELQGELGDLNMMNEQIDHHIDPSDVNADREELKAANDREARGQDEVFAERQKIIEATGKVRDEITAEKSHNERLAAGLTGEMRDDYVQMTADNEAMSAAIAEHEQQLERINGRVRECEEELQSSATKREAVSLYKQIAQLEQKRDAIRRDLDENYVGTPEEQQERILRQVKEDNQQISAMEREINDLENRNSEIETELADVDAGSGDGGEQDPEKAAKYAELVDRDQKMQEFLDSWDATVDAARAELASSEDRVLELLESIAQNETQQKGAMPTREDVAAGRAQLSRKQTELDRAETTSSSLEQKRARLTKDLANVNQLEEKISTEMASITEKMAQMNGDLETYGDLNGLRAVTESQKKRLVADKKRLLVRQSTAKQSTAELSTQYDRVKAELTANETYTQLQALEHKWQQLEKANFVMRQFVDEKVAETYFKGHVKTVIGLMKEHQAHLRSIDPSKDVSRTL